MEAFLSLVNKKILFVVLAVVIIGGAWTGGAMWLDNHDRAVRQQTENEVGAAWAKRLAEARLNPTVTKETTYVEVPAHATPPQVKPAAPVAVSGMTAEEHQRRLDSAKAVWVHSDANKDSLLEVYTQDREVVIEDALHEYFIGFSPLGTFDQPPLSFRHSVWNKSTFIPTIKINTESILPEEIHWYQTKTAYFIYGCVAATGAIYAGSRLSK